MTENQRLETSFIHNGESHSNSNTVVLRVPKPNLQITVLGLIAIITLFQTVQLVRISAQASTASVQAASAPSAAATTTTSSAPSGTGSNASVPQSQVGGC